MQQRTLCLRAFFPIKATEWTDRNKFSVEGAGSVQYQSNVGYFDAI
ncbi:hypothetical protein N1937_29455 (plasmid) [Rhizobium sp. WSM4643]|nr:hypothetical protein [Rhizobium leguminosarum]UWM78898.1 hypothetical protein N1937_29455 [Rhizobium leguminosarum bv. viciae]